MIKLQHWRAADAVLVELVDQYNHMWEDEDQYPEPPHIDVGHIVFNGAHIVLPDGLTLGC